MLVCPHCRTENLEEAGVCRHCGTALDAASSPMRASGRSAESEPALDLPPPRLTSPWPLAITLLAGGLALLGWGLFAAVQPNPCSGRSSSVLFPYCTEVPAGWAATPDLEPGANRDVYFLLRRSGSDQSGPMEPVATGAEVIGPGGAGASVEIAPLVTDVATADYVQVFRTSQEASGLDLGPLESVMLDGEQAIGWDFSVEQEDPLPTLHFRDVILVRAEGAWQIRFMSTQEAFDDARLGFERMLESWRWNE